MRREDVKVGMLVKTSLYLYGPNCISVGLIVKYPGDMWAYVLHNENIVSWNVDFIHPVKD